MMKCDRCKENKKSGHFYAVLKSVNSKAVVCEQCYNELEQMQRDTLHKWWIAGQTICSCYHNEFGRAVCYGTKEKEQCICKGNVKKCDFYPEKRGVKG